jgi:hypothetical protein
VPAPARDERVEVLLQRGIEPRHGFARRGAEGERDDGVTLKRARDSSFRCAGLGRECLGADSADRERNVTAVEDDAVSVDACCQRALHAVELGAALHDEPRVVAAGVPHAPE